MVKRPLKGKSLKNKNRKIIYYLNHEQTLYVAHDDCCVCICKLRQS